MLLIIYSGSLRFSGNKCLTRGCSVAAVADMLAAVRGPEPVGAGIAAKVAGAASAGSRTRSRAGSRGTGTSVAGVIGVRTAGAGPRGSISRIASPDFDISSIKHVGFSSDGIVSVICDFTVIVAVVCGYDRILIAIHFVGVVNGRGCCGNMCEFPVSIEDDDYIAGTNAFHRHFSGRIGVTRAEDTVTDKAGKSATTPLHTCGAAACSGICPCNKV